MKRPTSLPAINAILLFTLLLFMFLMGGCSSGGASSPSPVVTESFKTDVNKNVAIRSDALNKEFLLQGNVITLDSAQNFQGLKSRIVVFQKQNGKLFMLESQVGHTVTPDTPFALILAEFSIIAERDGWIWFDFNQGMSKIFTTAEMYASDDQGSNYTPSFAAASIRSSYLSEADASQLNRLSLRQAAQIEEADNALLSVEVRYYLYPYLKNDSFTSTPSPGFTNAGYFEVMPLLGSGGSTDVFAMKWDLSKKPITYYISSDTPAEYRQAVKDGVLYWNKALGEEIFAVADAPAGVTAPAMDRNIIQWVNYDTAGSAYADMQADPRTGEILHAQVFMPSAFAVGNKQDAWRFLKVMASSTSSAKTMVSLNNFYSPRICNLSESEGMTKNIAALLASNATDSAILKSAQAMVQQVVTHEVGHTMGLRHNFAGSLAVNYGSNKREDLYANFLNGGPYIPVVPSSSTMDYHDYIEEILIINRYNTEKLALSHDASAMRFLYKGTALDKTIPFCTDTDTDALDCQRFDYGASPLAYASSELKRTLSPDVLPVMFYLKLVADVMANDKAVADLHPSPSQKAASLLTNKPLLLAPFTQTGYYIRALKTYFPGTLFNDADKTQLRNAGIPYVQNDLAAWLSTNPYAIKSLTEMFMIVDPAWKDAWITRFNQLTNDPAFYDIVDQNGKERIFTVDERAQLRAMAATFFADLIPALVAEDVNLLSSVTGKIDIVDGTAGDALLAAMNATGNGYLTAQTGTSLNATVNGQSLTLPLFRYDWTVRLNASRLMNSRSVSSALWWGMRETNTNKTSLTALLDSSVLAAGGAFLSDTVSNGFVGASNAAFQWYLENVTILNKGFLAQ